jgi:hypothetical protein
MYFGDKHSSLFRKGVNNIQKCLLNCYERH